MTRFGPVRIALLATGFIFCTTANATELTFATDSGARGSPVGESLKRWANIVEEKTEGTSDEIEVEVFYEEELGGQSAVYDLHMAGEVDMMIVWPQTSYDARMGLRNVPYMFVNWDEAFEAYRQGGWLNELYNQIHNDLGLKFFGAYPEGFAGISTQGRYALTPEEAEGLTIRVPANFPNPQTVQAMGYSSQSIDWGEVYTAIQTGVVDGGGGNVIYWDYEYFRDVIDYYVRTRHTFVTGVLSANQATWKDLNADQKKIVAEAAETVSKEQFDSAYEEDQKYVRKAKEAGIEYIDPTREQMGKLAEPVREQVWPELERAFSPEMIEAIEKNATEF